MQTILGQIIPTTLGYDKLFNDIERLVKTGTQKAMNTYPPHNLVKLSETDYIVELAVAGFKESDIEITAEKGLLTIKGTREDKPENVVYLYRGIGTRSFTKAIALADTIEVTGATFSDGVLTINLENVVPEHKKQRKISISNNKVKNW